MMKLSTALLDCSPELYELLREEELESERIVSDLCKLNKKTSGDYEEPIEHYHQAHYD